MSTLATFGLVQGNSFGFELLFGLVACLMFRMSCVFEAVPLAFQGTNFLLKSCSQSYTPSLIAFQSIRSYRGSHLSQLADKVESFQYLNQTINIRQRSQRLVPLRCRRSSDCLTCHAQLFIN